MNKTVFTKINTIEIPHETFYSPVDVKNLHVVSYKFSFTEDNGLIKFVADLTSMISHIIYYEFETVTTFESKNAVFDDDLVNILYQYIADAYNEHITVVKNAFKSSNVLDLDLQDKEQFKDYFTPLEKALKLNFK